MKIPVQRRHATGGCAPSEPELGASDLDGLDPVEGAGAAHAGLVDDFVHVTRGIGTLLVVAGLAWSLLPADDLNAIRPLDGMFRSGNLGITALLTVTGFALCANLSDAIEIRGRRAAAVVLVRYLITVFVFLALAAAVVWSISRLDSTDTYTSSVTRESLLHVFSPDWNNYIRENALAVRADLVGLWYFSVEVQLAIILFVLLLVFGRRRRLLTVLLASILIALTWWRWYLMDTDGWFQAGLRTDGRADAFVYGVLAALIVREWQFHAATASAVAGGAMLLYGGFVVSASYSTISDFYRGQSAAVALATALILGAVSVADGHGRVFGLRGVPVLADLGRNWMGALVLSAPIVYTLARHSATLSSSSRTFAGVAVLAGALYSLDQIIRPLVTVGLQELSALGARATGGRAAATESAVSPSDTERAHDSD